jgi:hypothetical protein
MSELYVVGGVLRTSFFKQLPEWNSFKRALIVRVKPEGKLADVMAEYVSPEDACPSDSPSILFKSATVADGKLYVCTPTEVLVYQLPSFRFCTTYLSHASTISTTSARRQMEIF